MGEPEATPGAQGDVTRPISDDPAFESFYRDELEPLLETTEAHSRWAHGERRRRLLASIIAIAVAAVLTAATAFPVLDGWWWFWFVGLTMATTVLAAWSWWPSLGQSLDQKRAVAERVVPFYGDLEYRAHPSLDLHRYAEWGFLPPFDGRSVRDRIHGSHRGVPFTATSVALTKRRRRSGSSGTTGSATVGSGVFLELTLDQSHPGRIAFGTAGALPEKPANPKLSSRGNAGSGVVVHSTDNPDIWDVVTPSLLEGVASIQAEHEARAVTGGYRRGKLAVLIDRNEIDLEASSSASAGPGDRRERAGSHVTTFLRALRPSETVATDLRHHAERIRRYLDLLLRSVDHLDLEPKLEPGETSVRQTDTDRSRPSSFEAPTRRFDGWSLYFAFVAVSLLFAVVAVVARN